MLFASALTCFVFSVKYGSLFSLSRKTNAALGRELSVLLEKIDKYYIGEHDSGELSAAAMHAAVDALGDRWSYYMTPEEYAEYLNSAGNQFAGIGVSVVINEDAGGMEVMYIYKGSPAEKAGIEAGDIIIGIDGEKLAGMSLDEMREFLARPIGETADIELLRLRGITQTIQVVYDRVFTSPISYEMLDNDIGYIRIGNFDGGAADGFIDAAGLLLKQGAKAFVFDVRSNGGGSVNEMTRILDYLLPEGEIFISTDKSGHENIITSDPDMVDIPAVVIVNRYSFSAAEYFAETLREYGYAEIVGEQTTGKSRSQITEPLPGGGALHISSGQYITKNRVDLYETGGLTPDYPLVLSDEEFIVYMSGNLDLKDDPQLQLALSLLPY